MHSFALTAAAQPVLELPIELLEGDIPMNVAMEMPEVILSPSVLSRLICDARDTHMCAHLHTSTNACTHTHTRQIGQSQEEYDYRFIMSTFYVKCAFLLNRYAHGGEDEQGNSTMMSDEALRGYLRELHDERDLALEEFKQQNPDFDTAAVDAQMQAEKLEKKKLEEERGKEGTSTTTATATSSSSPSSSSSLS